LRLKAEQVHTNLQRGIAPIYLVSGDEPLQVQECLDAIRTAARDQGFTDRAVFTVDARFDWSVLRGFGDNLSLFAERRVIDLRLIKGKPDREGIDAIKAYAERPNPDHLMLISAPRMDGRSFQSAWLKAVDACGVIVQVWPVETKRLPGWVAQRARGSGVRLSGEAARLVAERSEGNLLACAQEIDKLKLLHGEAPVDVEEVLASVTDSARFGAFDLVDCVLEGDAKRAVRITTALREEGLDPLQVLGPLVWALRSANEIAHRLESGERLEGVLGGGKFAAWRRRQSGLRNALRRHSLQSWLGLLSRAGAVDRLAKGTGRRQDAGVKRARHEAWDALMELALATCGVRLLPESAV